MLKSTSVSSSSLSKCSSNNDKSYLLKYKHPRAFILLKDFMGAYNELKKKGKKIMIISRDEKFYHQLIGHGHYNYIPKELLKPTKKKGGKYVF